ncbi:metalloregulator ArsR/SmtB family transcription factor [Pantoea sp. B65]|uniref:metalloregulator ArsR/SmtB family transcription factor n=1 Tax=Pantoea sp. B65 TaxID=2813359 RepID=UPI0039B545A2
MSPLSPLQLFKYLSDETRLNMVLLLRATGELCVCDIAAALQLPQPKISRHLAMLREGGVLVDRRQGKWIYYQLSAHLPAWAATLIEQTWQSQSEQVATLIKVLHDCCCASGGKSVC